MSHQSDTHRDSSGRERHSRRREQTLQYHQGQRQPSVSQVQQQQLSQQQVLQQQYTASYASGPGYTSTGSYAGYDTPQGGQYETPGYPQAPSTRAHQGSAQDGQYSPGRDNTRVRIRGHQDDPEDPARRTESFVREGHDSQVASSTSSRSGRDIKKKKKDKARHAIDDFNAAYGDASSQANQYNYGSAPYYPDPDYPDCGDGPNYGGSSSGDH